MKNLMMIVSRTFIIAAALVASVVAVANDSPFVGFPPGTHSCAELSQEYHKSLAIPNRLDNQYTQEYTIAIVWTRGFLTGARAIGASFYSPGTDNKGMNAKIAEFIREYCSNNPLSQLTAAAVKLSKALAKQYP